MPCPGRAAVGKPVLNPPQPGRLRGFANQVQSRFGRCAPSLAAVARNAARDDVRPFGPSAARTRHHMVAGEFADRRSGSTVLAHEAVAGIDVPARKFCLASMEAHKGRQPHHGRHVHAPCHAANLSFRDFDDLGLVEDDELHRPLPADDVQWLERGIEQKNVFEEPSPWGRCRSTLLH